MSGNGAGRQSWAAASVFLLLEACLGISIDGVQEEITFESPELPEMLNHFCIENLQAGNGRVDLRLEREEQGVGIEVTRREGDLEVAVLK